MSRNLIHRLMRRLVYCCVFEFVFGGPVFAQCKPLGEEFRINTYIVDHQRKPQTAGLSGGGFVVTWDSFWQDGSDEGIYGQVFDKSGNKVGDELRVNTTTPNAQTDSSVAGLSGGGFVVTWVYLDSWIYNGDVYGQVFDSAGNKVGDEFLVNTFNPSYPNYSWQANPSVTSLTGGGFVVTWQSDGQESGNWNWGVYGQLFDGSGNKVNSEFKVNTYTTGFQDSPSATGLTGGGFVVTWQSDGQDSDLYGVYGQVFDSSGNKVGGEFRVNTYTTGNQQNPSVTGLPGGGFVVTWESGQDGSGFGIYGQVFDSAGNKVGDEFLVNTYTFSDQREPSAAGLLGGGFVVTWQSGAQDGHYSGVYGQVFDKSGNKVGDEFRVNTHIANYEENSSVSALTGGGFVVTWESWDQDGSGCGVYGQEFRSVGGVYKDGLVLDFGPTYGLHEYDQAGGWKQWNTVNPSQMVTVDLNGDGQDELVAAFPGYGLYTKDSANDWHPINKVDPEKMIAADIDGDGKDELVAGFAGYGLYCYHDPGGWSATPINTIIPEAMLRYSDGVVCDFGTAYGLWSYNTSEGWVPLNTVDPDKIVAADIDGDGRDELVVSFVGWGVYIYEPADKTWDSINTVIPEQMVAVDIDGDGNQEVVISFPGYGLYTYEPEGRIWDPINTEISEAMIRLGDGVAVDFGAAYGLWVWTLGDGWVQRNTADPGQMVAVDIDNDGVEELVVSFPGYGLYYYDEVNGWQLLNGVIPDDMKPINFYP